MKKTTGTDRSVTSKWRPQTRAVRAGTWRSEHGETSEALFLTSGYTYDDAATVAARFAGEAEGMTYSRLQNPTVAMLEERIAASQAWLSRASITVASMPNFGSRVSTSQRHEPNAARPATMWSPALSWHSSATVIAAIPLAWTRQASAPSIEAMRSSSMATVGFCSRE